MREKAESEVSYSDGNGPDEREGATVIDLGFDLNASAA